MQMLADDWSIIQDVDNGFAQRPMMQPIIQNEILPAIANKAIDNWDYVDLYKYDGLRIAYQGAGVEYQAEDDSWKDTSGIPVSEYVDRLQRISTALQQKYGVSANASASASSGSKVRICLLDASAEEIVSQEVIIQ